jgi:hypothetical protein
MMKCQVIIDEGNLPECGKDVCCFYCENKDTCKTACEDIAEDCSEQVEEETDLQIMESAVPDAIKTVTDIVVQMKKLEEQQNIMKQKLQEAMEQYGIKKFENEQVIFTYIEATTRKTFDKTKFQKEHPEISLADYDKVSNVKASVRIKVK